MKLAQLRSFAAALHKEGGWRAGSSLREAAAALAKEKKVVTKPKSMRSHYDELARQAREARRARVK